MITIYIELKIDEKTNEVVDDIINNLLGRMDLETLQMYFDFDKYLADFVRYNELEEVENGYIVDIDLR